MKKIMFIAVLFAGFNSFANDIKEEKRTVEESTTSKEASTNEESLECCTATLTYNGVYYDHAQFCGAPTQGGNCQMAKAILLARYPYITVK